MLDSLRRPNPVSRPQPQRSYTRRSRSLMHEAAPMKDSVRSSCTRNRERAMPGSVIVSAARTPIGKTAGGAGRLHRHGPRRIRHQGGAGAGRHRGRRGRLRDHGPGAPGRAGPDHRPSGGGQGRRPDDGAGHDAQQGLPVGHQRPLRRRPDDQRRRRRRRDRRRDGVDDQGPLPAARRPGRLPDGQRRADRLDDPRRAVVRLRRRPHGRGHREVHRPVLDQPPAAGRARRRRATSGPPPPSRTGASPTRSPRSRCRSARATRS